MGEFTCFIRDFDIQLPRQKIQEIFMRASNKQTNLDLKQFENSIEMIGHDLAKTKQIEN